MAVVAGRGGFYLAAFGRWLNAHLTAVHSLYRRFNIPDRCAETIGRRVRTFLGRRFAQAPPLGLGHERFSTLNSSEDRGRRSHMSPDRNPHPETQDNPEASMRWPNNPVSAALQRLSALAGPIERVSLTAPVDPAGAMLLRVLWPMGRRSPDPDMARAIGHPVKVATASRPADSTTVLPVADVATTDRWMYETAWALGAGYLCRWMQAPRIHAWEDEEAIPSAALMALHHAWGLPTYMVMGEPLTEGEALPEMVLEGARHGYWSWECNVAYRMAEWRFRAGTDWRAEWEAAHDAHEADGSRVGTPPDRGAWSPKWVARIAATYERLTDPEPAALGIACDLVERRYKEDPC